MIPAWYNNIPPHGVLEAVAKRHRLTIDEIRGPSRKRYICNARWDAMRLLRDRGMSLPTIGRILNRDHATIIHGLRRPYEA